MAQTTVGKRQSYETVSVECARLAGYRAVTTTYSLRLSEQRSMLDHVIADFRNCDVLLVRNLSGTHVALWRRKS